MDMNISILLGFLYVCLFVVVVLFFVNDLG